MSITIAGYNRIEAIYEGANTPLYRAFSEVGKPQCSLKPSKPSIPL